ncbi:MAG: Copper chaperone PCu(A)C [Pseudomonadota bacterium]
MMIGIKEPLKAGQTIKATLKFENAGTVVVDLKVKAMSEVHKHGHDDHHHNGQHHDGHHGKPAKH